MKSALVFFALAGSALAQGVAIFAPAVDAPVTAGGDLIVDVEKKPGLSGSTSVSVAIGVTSCRGISDCATNPAFGGLGQVLFKGNYDPQMIAGSGSTAQFQNFTVTIPATLPKGQAVLTVGYFFFGGAALVPGAESVNTTIIIQ